MTPGVITAILDSRVFQFIARLLLVITFVIPGILQLVQFNDNVGEFGGLGLHPAAAYVAASAITLLIGSALVLFGGRWTWLGAGALGVYTGLTILIVHHFWTMQGADRLNEMRTCFEHISLIGGLMLVAIAQNSSRKA
jgi:transmembrane protein